MRKQNKLIGLIGVTAMLIIGFYSLYANRKDLFAEVEAAYAEELAINLDNATKAPKLAQVLYTRGYFEDVADATFTANWICSRLREHSLPNLGTLNKKEFAVPVDTALALGGTTTRERAEEVIRRVGYDDEIETLYAQLPSAQADTFASGQHLIEVQVLKPDSSAGIVEKVKQRLRLIPDGKPVAGVLVRLTGHSYTTNADMFGNEAYGTALDSVMGYAVTGTDGVARFHVPTGYYSVLPIRRGYSYGSSKGTKKGILEADVQWSFSERTLTLTPLSSEMFARVKQDLSLTVRTPAQYKDSIIISVIIFLLAWWGGAVILLWGDRRRKAAIKQQSITTGFDNVTYTILMTLSAICLLAMFGTAQPLTDRNLGADMAEGIVMGVVAMCVFSLINLPRFYNGQSHLQIKLSTIINIICWPFRYIGGVLGKIFSPVGKLLCKLPGIGKLIKSLQNVKMPTGFGYLFTALVLMGLLYVFGTGPEGSDARVNLFFFQPSEVNKFLIVIMIAFFFARKAGIIQAFSQRAEIGLQSRQLAVIGVCMLVLLVAYGALSDMGPALVILVTFIIIYSVARRDTFQLLLGTLTFFGTLILARWINPTTTTAVVFAVLWLAAWVAGCFLLRRQLYESAIMMALVITTFILGGDILTSMGYEAIGQRLANRSAMAWSGIWANDIIGGDQVAQGIWGLTTGGLTGQGLGLGYPSYIPAYNTDMILAGIGEMLGWLTLVLIVLCLAALLHRTLLLARRAGHPFTFFLLTGIGVVTGIQFFVITLGSLGLIPLTGVAVPFLSFGKASMIVNLAAFGLVLTGSRERATDNQRVAIKPYDNVVATSAALFILLGCLVLGAMFYYQGLKRNDYLVRPAVVATVDGVPFAEYNPRIHRLEHALLAGNIYDRNGLLLATSSPDDIQSSMRQLSEAGLDHTALTALSHRRQRRYYPFGMYTVFAVGDLNDGLIRDDNALYPKGYGAEYRHMGRLRGFDNLRRDSTGHAEVLSVQSRRYRPSPFLPEVKQTFTLPIRDYSDPRFVAMLRGGEQSPLVKIWNEERHTRDLQLTIDARLQTLLQQRMEEQLQPVADNSRNGVRRKMRASVVVLNAVTGDLLCSANYPLPSRQSIATEQRYSDVERDRTSGTYTPQDLGTTYTTQPGSTAKVITEMAAFRKLGAEAGNLAYRVRANECIHDQPGNYDMESGLVRSVNAFNIHLAHDQDLYAQYADIDYLMGIRLQLGLPGERRNSYTPYYFYDTEQLCEQDDYTAEMTYLGQVATPLYHQLLERNEMVNGRSWTRAAQFGIAWGQHNILATPLAMARVAATVANNGRFVPTRYIVDAPASDETVVIDAASARLLQGYMRAETHKHQSNHPNYRLPATMGGKTGTPERVMPGRSGTYNDAWYICFVPSQSEDAPLAIAMRIERSSETSAMAVRYINNLVLPALRDAGYMIDAE
ncbi:MAG: FtsW/RodA/SpoVE family cell cycle protein [Prevotella sp.]|nr:FtsW/RodA/SpoVE family cell cycle protein [Prevotella sp.]